MRRITNSGLLVAIALCAVISLPLPWWHMSMHAPQYPDGLNVTVTLFGLTGNVQEVDELNHYIGFRPLASIAPAERHWAWLAIPAALLPLAGALFLRRRRFAWVTALPAAIIPIFFIADMNVWMWYAGHHLDPHAALSSDVSPWTPSFLGPGGVGQFHTYGMFDIGFLFAALAAIGTIVLIVRSAGKRAELMPRAKGAHAA